MARFRPGVLPQRYGRGDEDRGPGIAEAIRQALALVQQERGARRDERNQLAALGAVPIGEETTPMDRLRTVGRGLERVGGAVAGVWGQRPERLGGTGRLPSMPDVTVPAVALDTASRLPAGLRPMPAMMRTPDFNPRAMPPGGAGGPGMPAAGIAGAIASRGDDQTYTMEGRGGRRYQIDPLRDARAKAQLEAQAQGREWEQQSARDATREGLRLNRERELLTTRQQLEADQAARAEAARREREGESFDRTAGLQRELAGLRETGDDRRLRTREAGETARARIAADRAAAARAASGGRSSTRPISESERKAGFQYTAAADAATAIDGAERTIRAGQLARIPLVGNTLQGMFDPSVQVAEQSGRQFLGAYNMAVSGAAVTEQEYQRNKSTFVPEPGDTKATRERKAAARRKMLEAMRTAAGRAIPAGAPVEAPVVPQTAPAAPAAPTAPTSRPPLSDAHRQRAASDPEFRAFLAAKGYHL